MANEETSESVSTKAGRVLQFMHERKDRRNITIDADLMADIRSICASVLSQDETANPDDKTMAEVLRIEKDLTDPQRRAMRTIEPHQHYKKAYLIHVKQIPAVVIDALKTKGLIILEDGTASELVYLTNTGKAMHTYLTT